MALAVEFIYLAARLARQCIKERGIIVCALSVKFVYLAARWARREIVVSKTCRIIKTNGCYDQFLFIQTVLAVSHIRRSTSLRTQTYSRLLMTGAACVDKRQPKIVRGLAINAFSILLTL